MVIRALLVIGIILFVAWLLGGLLRSRTGR
jgi:flagellar biogenesis protein FliO